MLRTLLFLLPLSVLAGCATTVTPPGRADHPVTVYLTDEHIHSSVLLPVGGNRYLEYVKGDWNYAAMRYHAPWDVINALFFSQQAGLGRRVVEVNPDQPIPAPALPGARLNAIQVDRDQVQAVLVDLEMKYMRGTDLYENPESHVIYRRIEEPYGLFNNCNSMTKRSLVNLGCTVNSRSPFALYHVEPAPHAPALAGADGVRPKMLSDK